MDIGIIDGAFQFVGFGGTGEVGLQFQIYVLIGSYKVFLRKHSVVGVELHAFQAYVHVGGLHNKKVSF